MGGEVLLKSTARGTRINMAVLANKPQIRTTHKMYAHLQYEPMRKT